MKSLYVKPDITIREAMKKLSQSGEKCLVVVDQKNTLLGTLSDGDLRKAILNGSEVSETINKIYNSSPTILFDGEYSVDEVKELFIQQRFDLIPIVNNQRELKDILLLKNILKSGEEEQKEKLNAPVVIMAGGRGTRLEPFTSVLPKPLVPVDEKPIIEHIIEKFTDVGCNDIFLSVNYKGNIMKAYFDELKPSYNVSYIDEITPLGTAGSLRYLKGKFNNPFFVTNCDIVVNADYASLMNDHIKNNNDITLVASAKEYIIPYGTCEINDTGELSHINEKPVYDFLVNTGLYILNPEVLSLIPKDKFYHITYLIEEAKNIGKKVGVYPIDDSSWFDVGEWAEYKKTVKSLN
tara:strand:+ start:4948 stop:6000 length:1053 start_codon:yes stop_codon:yes gene_type:complete